MSTGVQLPYLTEWMGEYSRSQRRTVLVQVDDVQLIVGLETLRGYEKSDIIALRLLGR